MTVKCASVVTAQIENEKGNECRLRATCVCKEKERREHKQYKTVEDVSKGEEGRRGGVRNRSLVCDGGCGTCRVSGARWSRSPRVVVVDDGGGMRGGWGEQRRSKRLLSS